MTAPTRYCPVCYARSDWAAEGSTACGAGLGRNEPSDKRLA